MLPLLLPYPKDLRQCSLEARSAWLAREAFDCKTSASSQLASRKDAPQCGLSWCLGGCERRFLAATQTSRLAETDGGSITSGASTPQAVHSSARASKQNHKAALAFDALTLLNRGFVKFCWLVALA